MRIQALGQRVLNVSARDGAGDCTGLKTMARGYRLKSTPIAKRPGTTRFTPGAFTADT